MNVRILHFDFRHLSHKDKKMAAFIPNFLTMINLFCGALATISILHGHVKEALILHLICLVVDFLDGVIARKLNVAGPLGVQLDSLADVVSFGVFPGAIVYVMLSQSLVIDPFTSPFAQRIYLYPAFIITVFAALRLARFNISTEQSDKFIGLPSPAAAMFFSGLLIIQLYGGAEFIHRFSKPEFLYAMVILFSYLMNSHFIHFKIKPDRTFFKQPYLVILAGMAVGLVVFYPAISVSLIILLYSTLSIISNFIKI